MNKEDQEKSELGRKTLKFFFDQFGNDFYSSILLEELFKGLINEEALFVFGKQKQTGDQVSDNSAK